MLAGLFGIGGGTVMVPILYELFRFLGTPEEVRMPLCVGTSLAMIVPTSIASFLKHHHRGTVDMHVLRAWAIPVVVGVVIGAVLASGASPDVFKVVFIAVAVITGARLLAGGDVGLLGRDLPSGAPMMGYGVLIGSVSTLMGIGGGLLANAVMSLHGRPIRQAIATSSGLGVLISIPGAIGYAIVGLNKGALSPLSIGFVSPIAIILLMPTSLLCVGWGVALAHRLSKRHLECALALYLTAISARFFVG